MNIRIFACNIPLIVPLKKMIQSTQARAFQVAVLQLEYNIAPKNPKNPFINRVCIMWLLQITEAKALKATVPPIEINVFKSLSQGFFRKKKGKENEHKIL